MKAVDTNLLELLKKSDRFVVPIYQRVYSWDEAECTQLWADIVRAGERDDLSSHFTGSIVYIERDQGTRTSKEPDLIIDGQQRITTVILLLSALSARLGELPEGSREPAEGFSPEKIRGQYLTNPYESGEKFFKLTLSQRDREDLKSVISGQPADRDDSRVMSNYAYFKGLLQEMGAEELITVCNGISKLVVVDVSLTRGVDDPQLVFESMNATGKKLSQADLIRNYVLMDLPPARQERLYEDFWFPMERELQGGAEDRFDEFVRHYLTFKTLSIPRVNETYEAFKAYAFQMEKAGITREELVKDLCRYAGWFEAMALGQEPVAQLAQRFRALDQLATVTYPFQLRLYGDFIAGSLTVEGFAQILDAIIAYLFRRAVCRIPTNSLNKTFANLAAAVDEDRYVESICGRLLTLPDYRRFPTDEEFEEALRTTDMYHLKRRSYFFRTLENHGRKEEVSTAEYTIEHIMPQHATPAWQKALGPDWEEVHDRYLHTLGNLTLTGYNPEYSDRPFAEKRDMAGGFRESPLRLNQGLGQLETWSSASIERRAGQLAAQAVEIWARPALDEQVLADYSERFSGSGPFDWTQTHTILAALPPKSWTSYNALAEAVGTGPQAMARHLATCGRCTNPYRVLTWDGRLAEDFHWTDPADDRDPAQLLISEGVSFIDSRADPQQHLRAEDLLTLVGEDEF